MIPRPAAAAFSGGRVLLGPVTERLDPALAPEAYVLEVDEFGVDITAGSPAGAFYARQTLRQLLPPAALRRAPAQRSWIAAVRVEDAPRFGWRGVLLDVARHFLPVADVLRFIDLLAFHKLNVLHLHLTDDQGWRLSVPGWPRLTEVGAWRPRTMLGSRGHELYDERPHGGFYTDDDLREIVAYAGERFVRVVPEVDMPGHMQAAIAAYPELGNGFTGDVRAGWGISEHVLNPSPATLEFCRQVLDHVCSIFPDDLIGIGGDECPRDEWQGADHQPWFTTELAAHLRTHGRRVYGWDEILTAGAPPDATIAAWRGTLPAVLATNAGHDVVSCPDTSVYLDYRQSDDPGEPTPVGTLLTLADVYAFDPVPAGADPQRIAGAQANIWTEHMESARRIDYMAFPRLCAFAEVVWGTAGDYADFATRLESHLDRLDALGVNYRPLSGPRPWDGRPDAPGNPQTRAHRQAEVDRMTQDLAGFADNG